MPLKTQEKTTGWSIGLNYSARTNPPFLGRVINSTYKHRCQKSVKVLCGEDVVANVVFAQPCMPFTLKVSVSLHWFLYLYTELLYERKSLGEIFSRYCIAAVSHFFGKFFAKNTFF